MLLSFDVWVHNRVLGCAFSNVFMRQRIKIFFMTFEIGRKCSIGCFQILKKGENQHDQWQNKVAFISISLERVWNWI